MSYTAPGLHMSVCPLIFYTVLAVGFKVIDAISPAMPIPVKIPKTIP